jgi:hypothetical protein
LPAVRPLPPSTIRGLLEAKGYKLVASDDYNWAFALGDDDEPIFVPSSVSLVPLEIAFQVARKVGFNDYFDAIDVTAEPFPPDTTTGTRPQ